jgi:hypothetical protein
MATFTVTNTNDSGIGSLRQAIQDAKNLVGADTILLGGLFTDSIPDIITFTSGQLTLQIASLSRALEPIDLWDMVVTPSWLDQNIRPLKQVTH